MSNKCPFCNKDLSFLYTDSDGKTDVSEAMKHLLICDADSEEYKNNSSHPLTN